ncbi:HK97 family phage prohead protease/HK97 family phage major capsid protein,TIGR01554 [Amycolatopsis sulphurea]|uniref:HK97 family phage prohead protease/HK97 family phage major capsid protein,TIGR01554 n=1 Tax=Amycolatopsis sulphurea TaxID=76022 RepID=A0A2A9FC94_9PSEU|nr:phage major capsid protein [Amycolatopsis sulphurea]PFG48120.1 HK97 family phage prohead protease/HK97 family phage major capsid protein,TIGR01554 [Amycolatopsis sulphurea]
MTTERRDYARPVELRSESENITIRGYAYVFGALSHDLGGFRERVERGAGRESMARNEMLATFNHNVNAPLARTGAGLRVGEDDTGGWYEIDLPDTSTARDLAELIRRGVVAGSSFTFSLPDARSDQEWTETRDGGMVRTLRRIDVVELGPVLNPAYPDTSAALRALDEVRSTQASHARPTTAAPTAKGSTTTLTTTELQETAEERARAEHALNAADADGATDTSARILEVLDRLDTRFAELFTNATTAEARAEAAQRTEEARSLAVNLLSHGAPQPQAADTRAKDNTTLRGLNVGEGAEFRAVMGVGVDMANKQIGKAVPADTLYTQLVEIIAERSNVIVGGARSITTSTGEKLTFPRVTPARPTAKPKEAEALPENYPGTDTVSNSPEKYGYVSHLSAELVQDDAVDLVGFLAADAGPNLADQMGRDFLAALLGGIVVKESPAKLTKEADAADFVIDLFYDLPTAAANRASWLMGRKAISRLRKLKDGNGQYLLKSVSDGSALTLMGRPVLRDAGFDDDNTKVVLSDLSGFVTRFAGPLRVARSTEAKFVEDLVSFKFVQRAAGTLVDATGSALLTLPATGAGA